MREIVHIQTGQVGLFVFAVGDSPANDLVFASVISAVTKLVRLLGSLSRDLAPHLC